MSAMTIVVLIAGYLGFVGFVLALLTTAKRSGEAAERQRHAVATSREALRRPQGVIRDAGFDADAAEFLEGLGRRSAREFESRRLVSDRTPVGKARRD